MTYFWVFCPLLALTIAGLYGVARYRWERRWRLALDAFACQELAKAAQRQDG